jgi:hypothetical protein
MPYSIRYSFSQRFCNPASEAYKWCTNYTPQDHALMHESAKREILHITEDTILLIDTHYKNKRSIRKRRLVKLDPDQLSWTSTHLTGPNKYSQFHYEIKPESKNSSRLYFTGVQIEYCKKEKPDDKTIQKLGSKLRKQDSAAWKLLANEMTQDVGKTT